MARKQTSIDIIPKKKTAEILTLSIDDMYVDNGKGRGLYLKRLRYLNVPTLKNIHKWKNSSLLINAGRDDDIRNLYDLCKSDKKAYNFMCAGSVYFFRYIDSIGYSGDNFDIQIMSKCLKHYNTLALKGVEYNTARSISTFLGYFLKKMDRENDIRQLPVVKVAVSKDKNPAYDIETELQPIAKLLWKSFSAFITHIKNGTYPEIHPIYDETLFKNKARRDGLSKKQISFKIRGFRSAVQLSAANLTGKISTEQAKFILIVNQTGRVVLQSFYMLTGMNASVLSTLVISDVTFIDIGKGRYNFSGIKARAGYKDIDNNVGFGKQARDAIECWLETSVLIYQKLGIPRTGNSPFIPYIDTKGNVFDFSHNKACAWRINFRIKELVDFTINSSRFRKTKADILMRVTEDVFLVSQGLNNTMNVTARSYSDGVKASHENHLSALFSSQALIAKGEAIDKSVATAKVLHSDILVNFDRDKDLNRYQCIPTTTVTPTGIHCKGASQGKLDEEIRKLKDRGVDLDSDEKRCTDFFSCFDCESHVLIATEMDIWLMLSFHSQVTDIKRGSTINPKWGLEKVEVILDKTLDRFKEKAPKVFNNATQRLENDGYHPLFANLHSLKYLMGF